MSVPIENAKSYDSSFNGTSQISVASVHKNACGENLTGRAFLQRSKIAVSKLVYMEISIHLCFVH